ncbi:hypothetical protein BDL97_17G021000 [Sphagnum fallax]|nr:hypothetical protein BDL97_17G021000 [Sphagnum fallax]
MGIHKLASIMLARHGITDFFWSSIYPGGGGQPDGEVLELIERDFGSFEEFTKEFKAAGVSQFGSGWVWLILKDAKLSILKTSNALNPLIWGYIPLTVVDVCEVCIYICLVAMLTCTFGHFPLDICMF